MGSVLITDDCHPLLQAGLESLGWSCDFLPDITPEGALAVIGKYEGLVINSKIKVDKFFLDAAEKLRFVARLGSGMEIVDRGYAAQKGVQIFSSPEGNRNAVAEQALGMLLALSNNLLRADREVRQNIWQRAANRGWELSGKTIGIIGFGHTGSQFARKLAGMEMEVLAYDKYKPQGYSEEFSWVNEVSLAQIQVRADIISLHLPLTEETFHWVNADFLQSCKHGVVLINTARGQHICTENLIEALENGQVGGACLDVFEQEKPHLFTENDKVMYERLHALPNVVLSPHIAGWTQESKKLLADILLQKISAAFKFF